MKWQFLVLFLLILPLVTSLTPEERTYLDVQNQKTIAQLTARIDQVEKNVQTFAQKEFEDSTRFAVAEVEKSVSSGIKALAIAIAGIVIASLAVFKIIDMKLSTTRGIQKYENDLKEKIENNKIYKQQLDTYRDQLLLYMNQIQQGLSPQKPEVQILTPVPKTPKKSKFWLIFIIVIIVLILSTIGFFAIRYFMR